jgi:hypothetical protein
MTAAWGIPDWASVSGFVWALGATAISVVQWLNRRASDNLTQRFLVGLKGGINNNVDPMLVAINDELLRLKPAKWAMVWLVGGVAVGLVLGGGSTAWLLKH